MTVKSVADIVAEMISALAVSDPQLDTSIGSVVRKILDVTAEQVAPAYAESYLSEYAFSVDTKSGADLDDFCAMFGIYRQVAQRAIGGVTFFRPAVATSNIEIPANTQISAGTIPDIVFATTTSASLIKGTTSVSVPIQAVVAGESGNLPAGSLTNLATSLSGISTSTAQSDSAYGGVNAESDDSLKARFKATVFRSMAGTHDMFLGVAIEDTTPDNPLDAVAVQANVLGASKHWREQVQTVQSGSNVIATSTIPASSIKYIFANSAVFGPDIDNGQILTEGVHFTFNNTVFPPTVTAISGNLNPGGVYDLDFEYVPSASRNDPASGITNRVDIWVSGVSAQAASETTYYQPQTFSATSTDPLYVNKFVRLSGTGLVHPTVGNKFVQLAWGPITDFPAALAINGITYVRGTDFWVVHDDTAFGYSSSSMFGLEFLTTNQPVINSQILLSEENSYFYNRLPADVEARAARWKLVTTDVKAHAAKQVNLILNFAVMYLTNYDRGVVQAGLDTALNNWMGGLGFRSVVQISDILSVAHNVAGVDNIRLLNSLEPGLSDDANSWGVEQVASDGTYISNLSTGTSTKRSIDIVLAENQVPVLYNIRYTTKAQNSYNEPSA